MPEGRIEGVKIDINNIAVICTKDRENDLHNLLTSIENQSQNFSEVIIVDSSKNNNNLSLNKYSFTISHYKTEPGLTYQRNFGLSKIPIKSDFCHFFDDDVELDHNYLLNFNDFAFRNPNFQIFTGRQVNACKFSFSRLFLRLTGLNGKVLWNGINISPNYCNKKKHKELSWMPGCNMIFASDIFLSYNILFDEKYRSGYCMGEDVDISIKIRKIKKIIYLPNSIYSHNLSDQNRSSEVEKYLEFLTHRYILTKEYPEQFSKKILFISIYLEQTIFLFLNLIIGGDKYGDWYIAIKQFKKNYKNNKIKVIPNA